MRLWTIHPRYLDARGLVALWREALLAQAVLAGRTRGYRHHPQLERFRSARSPDGAMARYLAAVQAEASRRGYRFDRRLIRPAPGAGRLRTTDGQLAHEWAHLLQKLRGRDGRQFAACRRVATPAAHPLFRVVAGGVEPWERIGPGRARAGRGASARAGG
jgi:hypothetical protein